IHDSPDGRIGGSRTGARLATRGRERNPVVAVERVVWLREYRRAAAGSANSPQPAVPGKPAGAQRRYRKVSSLTASGPLSWGAPIPKQPRSQRAPIPM